MKSNKKSIIVGGIISLVLIGMTAFVLSRNEKANKSIMITLERIYKNSKIKAQEDPYHYIIDTTEFYAKEIEINGIKLFLTVENYNDQGGIYRFYTLDKNPELLKNIDSLIPIENSDQVFNENFFQKDINGDGTEELFLRVQMAGSGGISYEILHLDNNVLTNIKLEGQKDNWVDFDNINYKDGYIYTTWHAVDATGKTKYHLKDYILIPVKNVGIFIVPNSEDDCEVRVNKVYDEFSVIEKNKCDIILNKFDNYFIQ